jgi:hypothetical protein
MIGDKERQTSITPLDTFCSSVGFSEKAGRHICETVEGIRELFHGDKNFHSVRPIPHWGIWSNAESPDVRYQLIHEDSGRIAACGAMNSLIKERFPHVQFPMDHLSMSYFQSNLERHAGTTEWASMVAEACGPWTCDDGCADMLNKLVMRRMRTLRDVQETEEQLKAFLRTALTVEFETSFQLLPDGSAIRPVRPMGFHSNTIPRFHYWRGRFFELLAQSRL